MSMMRIAVTARSIWRKAFPVCLAVVAGAIAPAAFAAKPANPAVSITAGLKQLNFWWGAVPGATRYELWYLPLAGATWVEYDHLPASRTSVSVNISAHLLNWQSARFVLKACNSSGCGRTPHLFVSHLMQQTVGYFSRPVLEGRYQMGYDVALAESGNALAATFVKNAESNSAGVTAYRKTNSGWTYEAELLADPPGPYLPIAIPDPAVAISGNGDVIALGGHEPVSSEDPDSEAFVTAVYVFRRTATGWAREQKLSWPDQAPWASADPDFRLYRRVELDESGTLLAARSRSEIELFRYSNGAWTRVTTFPLGCETMGLSGDGTTLAVSCGSWVQVFKAPTWQRVASLPNEEARQVYTAASRVVAVSHDGTRFALRSVTWNQDRQIEAWVNVYRLGTSGWAREATLAPGSWTTVGDDEGPSDGYGQGIAMSHDGRFIAVSAARDGASGHGAIYPPYLRGVGGLGAVYIYERKPTGWRLRQLIKPNEGGASWDDRSALGLPLSFGRNAKDLAVGGAGLSGAANVVGGPLPDDPRDLRGAIWLY